MEKTRKSQTGVRRFLEDGKQAFPEELPNTALFQLFVAPYELALLYIRCEQYTSSLSP